MNQKIVPKLTTDGLGADPLVHGTRIAGHRWVMHRLVPIACFLALGCGEPVYRSAEPTDAGPPIPEADAGALDPDPDAGPDPGPGPDPAISCGFLADDYGSPMRRLDTGPGGAPLRFFVRGLPDPALVDSAVLRFTSHDADHPGEEGAIFVNGEGPFDLPADASWDNADGAGELDVTAHLVGGDNLIEFAPGPLPRSFFGIGDVRVDATARVDECAPPPPPPEPGAVERSMHYRDAVYSNRRTWVVRCDDYAFTASGDEHVETDCDGAYRPGGDRRGTATFTFTDVVRADYEVIIRSRHTENRNPAGALFVVDGVERRISQRSDRDRTDDVWGVARLEGAVDVVLDSSREGQSDSVISVRLMPVAP